MTSKPELERIQADYAQLLKYRAADREQKRAVAEAAHKMREEVRNVSRGFDSQLVDRISKADQTAIRKDAKKAQDLLQSTLVKLKAGALPAGCGRRQTQRRAVSNAMRAHKNFPTPAGPHIEPPPWLSGLLQWLTEHSIRHGQLTPPAYGCGDQSSLDVTCFPDTGLLKLSDQIKGDGWGWAASPGFPTVSASMVFIYFPPIEGILTATANIHLFGTVLVHAVDHWYATSDADLDLELTCGITQGTQQLASNSTPVVNQHRGNSTFFQAFDQVMQAPCTAYVLPETPVFITVGAYSNAWASSEFDTVDVDFASHDPEKYLLIESIDISLDPAT